MPTIGIDVPGLDEFRRQLRQIEPKLSRELGKLNKKAAEIVAREARARAEAHGSSAAKGADSIVATAKSRAAILAMGGPKAPWMQGAEFGAIRYAQFPPFTGNQWTPNAGNNGRFYMPAIRDTRDDFESVYLDAIDEFARTVAGFK